MVRPPQPSVPDLDRFAGVPDVHGAEMGAVRVGIANALHDGDVALIIHRLQRGAVRVPGEGIVDGQDFILLEADHRPGVVVDAGGIGDDGVHKVVAAAELHDNEDGCFVLVSHCCLSFRNCSL